MTKIGPTLACANLMNVAGDIRILDDLHVDTYHIDIMDGNFVPNYCLSWDFVRQLKTITSTPIDVHLMTTEVDRDIETALSLGISALCFHVESSSVTERLSRIRKASVKAGLAVSPETAIASVEEYLPSLDYVLLMGVKPGFSGQKFKEETYDRIRELAALRTEKNLSFSIYVDGGIDDVNGPACAKAGADILVAGALCIYKKGGDLRAQTLQFQKALEER